MGLRKLISIILLFFSIGSYGQGNFFMWHNIYSSIWTQITSAGYKPWSAINIGSDGEYQVAGISDYDEGVRYSLNYAGNWSTDVLDFWVNDIASSAAISYNIESSTTTYYTYAAISRVDGYANSNIRKRVFNSSTLQYEWIIKASGIYNMGAVDCSSSGDVVAYIIDDTNGYTPTVHAYTSIDGGDSFYAHTFSDLSGEHPISTAVSGDGERILVCFDNGYVKVGVQYVGPIYNWLGYYIAEYIKKGAISNDGSRISLAISNAKYVIMINSGEVRVRTISDINLDFRAIAMSDSGEYQVIVSYEGYVFLSKDYGETWKRQSHEGTNLVDVTMSNDGKKITCIGNPGYIYTLNSN